ncbi:hypothetical protein HY229_00715 [Candidatus Acetothermia bacterium]|nr:hypothetical protein [Candidatus Acetothermia bacterium]MBI3642612.1 hypothetical protein [Candidatus Acetothermia bacterium]
MYLTVRRYEKIDNPKEVERRVKAGFVPLISKIPGFVAYNLVNAGNGVMLSTSIFQDKAGADESTKRSHEWVKKDLADLKLSPPQVTAGEILILTYADLSSSR